MMASTFGLSTITHMLEILKSISAQTSLQQFTQMQHVYPITPHILTFPVSSIFVTVYTIHLVASTRNLHVF